MSESITENTKRIAYWADGFWMSNVEEAETTDLFDGFGDMKHSVMTVPEGASKEVITALVGQKIKGEEFDDQNDAFPFNCGFNPDKAGAELFNQGKYEEAAAIFLKKSDLSHDNRLFLCLSRMSGICAINFSDTTEVTQTMDFLDHLIRTGKHRDISIVLWKVLYWEKLRNFMSTSKDARFKILEMNHPTAISHAYKDLIRDIEMSDEAYCRYVKPIKF